MAIKQRYSIIIISVLLSCITFKSNHVNRNTITTLGCRGPTSVIPPLENMTRGPKTALKLQKLLTGQALITLETLETAVVEFHKKKKRMKTTNFLLGL